MADHLIIETPEQIPLEFALAGIGSRFLAVALDTAIEVGAGALLVGLWLALVALGWLPGGERGGAWTAALLVLAGFLLEFGYFAFFEALWNGQTPGKRYVHIRVIKNDGRPISAYEAVTRNLLRIVDSIPGIYAVGILSALFSSEGKRLGDFAAGTVVVREQALAAGAGAPGAAVPAPAPLPAGAAERLSEDDFQLIEAFLLRRSQLGAGVRDSMARRIAERVSPGLGLAREDLQRPEALLERLAAAYRARARFH